MNEFVHLVQYLFFQHEEILVLLEEICFVGELQGDGEHGRHLHGRRREEDAEETEESDLGK